MPYLKRAADGSITSLHRQADAAATEFLADEHPEVQAFVGNDDVLQRFAQLDAGFIRVLEDLIDVLIRAKVMNLTDLPIQAQRKLFSRKGHRAPSALSELNLLGDLGRLGDGPGDIPGDGPSYGPGDGPGLDSVLGAVPDQPGDMPRV